MIAFLITLAALYAIYVSIVARVYRHRAWVQHMQRSLEQYK